MRAHRAPAVAGLVSVPTTVPRHQNTDAARLREHVGAFLPDVDRARIARLRRAVGFAARAHLAPELGHRPDAVFMVTYTYGDGANWKPEHLSDCIRLMRKWLARRGLACRYVWVAELQKRGAIHYHLALWLPAGVFLPAADAQGWWPHGSTRTERARGAVGYLMKYLSKGGTAAGHTLPDGARMYGVGGLDFAMRRAARWLRLPAFVQSRSDCFDHWDRATGGGWWSPDGVVVPSEFQRVLVAGQWCLQRIAHHGRPFDAAGPFTWLHRRPEQTTC